MLKVILLNEKITRVFGESLFSLIIQKYFEFSKIQTKMIIS